MSKEVRLDIGGSPDEINRITAAVEQLAEAEAWPPDLAFQITLALEEVAMNIINYAYEDQAAASGQLVIQSEAERLTITITDQGKPFNPLEDAPEPDTDAALQDREIGGLGIHLVRTMMDETHYIRQDDSNRLTLVKLKSKDRGQ